ncbi:MAG: hypothetical protein AABW81_00525 [Nanoarchaeota archaeon]
MANVTNYGEKIEEITIKEVYESGDYIFIQRKEGYRQYIGLDKDLFLIDKNLSPKDKLTLYNIEKKPGEPDTWGIEKNGQTIFYVPNSRLYS